MAERGMEIGRHTKEIGRKLLAVGVLLLVAFLLFKAVAGFVAGLVWIAVAVLAVVAVIWATRVL
jgi:hypothetical protein